MPVPRRRQPRSRYSSSASSSTLSLDQRRWLDFRSGMSEAELAARENVKLETIQASLQRMRARQQSLSLEQTNETVREHIIESLPIAFAALEAALAADVYQAPAAPPAAEITTDADGNLESVSLPSPPPPPRPDHSMRLRAFKELKEMITSIQPKTPMVAVDARTQVNNAAPAMLASGQPLSTESLIRQIRAERGLALTDGSMAAGLPVIAAAVVADEATEVDYELQEELAEEPLESADDDVE